MVALNANLKHRNICEQWGVLSRGASRTELPFQSKIILASKKEEEGGRWEEGTHDCLLAAEETSLNLFPTPGGSALPPGHLEFCFKACFLTTYDLFHGTTCAWLLGIRRPCRVNYEPLAMPANQTAVGGGVGRSLFPRLLLCPAKNPGAFSEAVDGEKQKRSRPQLPGPGCPSWKLGIWKRCSLPARQTLKITKRPELNLC